MQQLKELMSRDVKVVGPDMTIGEAAKKMRDGDFGMLPVGEDDRMIGTISDRDIAIRAVAEGKGTGTKVRDVMSEGDRLGLRGRLGRTGGQDHEQTPGAAFAGGESRKALGRHRGAGRFCRRKLGNQAGRRGTVGNLKTILARASPVVRSPGRRFRPPSFMACSALLGAGCFEISLFRSRRRCCRTVIGPLDHFFHGVPEDRVSLTPRLSDVLNYQTKKTPGSGRETRGRQTCHPDAGHGDIATDRLSAEKPENIVHPHTEFDYYML